MNSNQKVEICNEVGVSCSNKSVDFKLYVCKMSLTRNDLIENCTPFTIKHQQSKTWEKHDAIPTHVSSCTFLSQNPPQMLKTWATVQMLVRSTQRHPQYVCIGTIACIATLTKPLISLFFLFLAFFFHTTSNPIKNSTTKHTSFFHLRNSLSTIVSWLHSCR